MEVLIKIFEYPFLFGTRCMVNTQLFFVLRLISVCYLFVRPCENEKTEISCSERKGDYH